MAFGRRRRRLDGMSAWTGTYSRKSRWNRIFPSRTWRWPGPSSCVRSYRFALPGSCTFACDNQASPAPRCHRWRQQSGSRRSREQIGAVEVSWEIIEMSWLELGEDYFLCVLTGLPLWRCFKFGGLLRNDGHFDFSTGFKHQSWPKRRMILGRDGINRVV